MMPEFATAWTRSSYCADATCVEVAVRDERVLLRDGKNTEAPYLQFSFDEWDEFRASITAGDYTFE